MIDTVGKVAFVKLGLVNIVDFRGTSHLKIGMKFYEMRMKRNIANLVKIRWKARVTMSNND